ncbi:hypothetical protein ACFSQQ_26205 [Mesorhizobium kowhaii]|uniref:hypothetical protein n=1 Tax=Mesorhizobium kowhaii TaxID=1300272 RepID=UPI0035ECE0CE
MSPAEAVSQLGRGGVDGADKKVHAKTARERNDTLSEGGDLPDLGWFVQALGLRASLIAGLALACAILVLAPVIGVTTFSGIDPTVMSFARVGLAVFGSLTLMNLAVATWGGVRWIGSKLAEIRSRSAHKAAAAASLNELTARERNILAFLVTRNERHFVSNINGGYAASLIGRGLIHLAARPGQSLSALSVPFTVDEYVWEALQARREEFKHANPTGKPPYSDNPFA